MYCFCIDLIRVERRESYWEHLFVTVLTETGEQKKLQMEAAPRISNLNFFSLDNRPVNREQFQKVMKQGKDITAGKEKGGSQSQEMAM